MFPQVGVGGGMLSPRKLKFDSTSVVRWRMETNFVHLKTTTGLEAVDCWLGLIRPV
jgi:hypothetical protein